jgi:hypothetical protein
MAYVPKDAEWFLAEMVQEIRVAGCKRNIVHQNFVIIHARTPEAAYIRACKLGKSGDTSYINENGKRVITRFRGLRSLDVIYDPLEDGCEIMFIEKLGVTEKGIKKLVRLKRDLEVFLPIRGRPGRPNYSSKEIMDEARKELEDKR